MIGYKYNPSTFKLIGSLNLQQNPANPSEFLSPPDVTTVAPPSGYSADECPAFNTGTQTWYLTDSDSYLADQTARQSAVSANDVALFEDDGSGKWVARPQADIDADEAEAGKEIAKDNAKITMDSNIQSKAFEISGADTIVAAQNFFQAYQLRASNASEYVSEGLVAHYANGTYALNDALDTEVKIQEYYSGLCVLMDKFRNTEINTYAANIATIEAS